MKIRMEQRILESALAAARGIVDKKSVLNVLAHAHFETVGKDVVRVSATDYDVTLIATYPCEVEEAGSACIACNGALAAVKTLPDLPVTLATMPNHWADMACGKARLHMLGIPPEDFPVIPPPDASGIVMLARTDLLRVMGYCAPCVSADVTRFALCGVLLELDPAPDDPAHAVRAQATATDGHRLAHIAQTCPVPDALREPLRAILHRRGVEEIRRVGGAGDCDTIGIGRHEGSIVFYCGASLLIVKAIEDEFPEYQKIIPEAPPTLVNVGSADIEAVLKTAASVTSAKVALVKLTADPDGKLTFFGSNPDSGDATATCDADVKGPTATIGLNARFVAEALDACDAADVRLGLTDDASPVVFRAFEDDGALTVVMPMRI